MSHNINHHDDNTASRNRFREWGSQRLLGHAIPKKLGGRGDGFTELTEAHRALGRSCMDTGQVLALNAHLWGSVFPILSFGTKAQQQELLPSLLSGESVGGHAITEPQAGSDLHGLEASATQMTNGYRLDGHKRYITNTPIADWLIIYARLGTGAQPDLNKGLSAFLVHRSDSGADFSDAPSVDACQQAPMGDVILDACIVPEGRLLGPAGNGALIAQQALELERAFIFAGISGILDNQLKMVVQHARKRRIGGRPLGHNQAISHRIADMKVRLDTLGLWIRHCAELKDLGRRITNASSQTKLYGAEAFLQSSLDAVQILGAAGLEHGEIMGRLVQDAMASRLFSGSSEVQKNIIASLLGVGSSDSTAPSTKNRP